MKSKRKYLNSEFSVRTINNRLLRYEARKRVLLVPVIALLINSIVMIVYGTIQLFN